MPPDVESTSGVKTPCSISSMHWPYVLFFSSSYFLYAAGRLLELLLGALGWNTLTSKKASWRVFQKPLARTSSRAPSSVLVEASLKDSQSEGLSRQWLQMWFDGHIGADFCEQGGR